MTAGDDGVRDGPGNRDTDGSREPARRPPLSRRRVIGLFIAAAATIVAAVLARVRQLAAPRDPTAPTGSTRGTGGLVLLDIAGADGELLDFDGVLEVQTNGGGEDARDDALLDAETLELIELAPLQRHAEASAAVQLPAGRTACLNLSWPTSHGYSALLVDLPGPGHYALAELAARGLHEAQEDVQTRMRATGSEAREVDVLRTRTARALQECDAAAAPAERAISANSALEAATAAQLAQDEAASGLGPEDAMLGVTFTAAPASGRSAQAVSRLEGAGRTVLVRIVVEDTDAVDEMDGWRRCVTELHEAGAQVMVQICDSQALVDFDEAAWTRRIAALIAAFPDADAWEIGNELAGEWAGSDAVERTLQAARALAADPATASAPRLLTLYYQLGQGTATESVMSWAAVNLGEELTELTDVVGLSVYPQWHPLGSGARRVLDALGRVVGDKRTALTELGYGAEDLNDGPWWFGSPDDVEAGRAAVARHLTAAALGQPRAWAAPLWWYYLQDEGVIAPDTQDAPGLSGQEDGEDGSGAVAQDLVEAARIEASD
ncbi:Tat pathway signal sequence [Actinomyces sp. Z5]|uniref:Tat pathway signal sequence n=1 Tax=Actinomyces sp. Z5 TaxID=2250216 RepID=UPI000DCC6F72|nr:Tat pathway signal sequence [Actinomyces sp. Z5]RAX23115.1 Tat pathway signal sequence [Actinomyces sp. Z5]